MSPSQPVAKTDVQSGESSRQEASTGAYGSDHELSLMVALCESNVGKVKAQIELRQEAQRTQRKRVWSRTE